MFNLEGDHEAIYLKADLGVCTVWNRAPEGTDAEWESAGRLPDGEVHRVYGWGAVFDGDGCGLHTENDGSYPAFSDSKRWSGVVE